MLLPPTDPQKIFEIAAFLKDSLRYTPFIASRTFEWMRKEGTMEKKKAKPVVVLVEAALIAALSYVVFTFLKIPVATAAGKSTYIHVGNAFAALGAFLIGGPWGGLAAGIGMAFGDLFLGDPINAVKTVICKLIIGLVAGLIGNRLLKVNSVEKAGERTVKVTAAAAIALLVNVVTDPFLGYLRNRYIYGLDVNVSSITAKLTSGITFINAIISTIAAVLLYQALRPALKKLGYL